MVVNAIQIEVINCIRDNRYCREKFAADMADCIFEFVSPFVSGSFQIVIEYTVLIF
jgi:hypothetical protein